MRLGTAIIAEHQAIAAGDADLATLAAASGRAFATVCRRAPRSARDGAGALRSAAAFRVAKG
ncbi:hypothetical protein ACOZ38_32995 [Sphaerisporangium viridialbum]|uniref:hypothetical protein n=1 Tax=Sphaerisporangium viridialbum TaxID=46189 RepID=UPI003C77CF7C